MTTRWARSRGWLALGAGVWAGLALTATPRADACGLFSGDESAERRVKSLAAGAAAQQDGDYESIFAGHLDPSGVRRSVFEPTGAGGTPRLVAALWARWDEQTDGVTGEIRGMPLALPALHPEQIQLVDSWIAQGRPR